MLTQNTITFTRTYLSLLTDCLVIYSTDMANVIDQLLYEVFAAHCNYIKNSMKNKNFVNDVSIYYIYIYISNEQKMYLFLTIFLFLTYR